MYLNIKLKLKMKVIPNGKNLNHIFNEELILIKFRSILIRY